MKILNRYLDFKNEIKEVEVVGSAVFSTDSEGRVWHDTTREIQLNEEIRTSKFIMIDRFNVVQIEEDPSKISPIDNSLIFEIENNIFQLGDFVYFDFIENNLIKIESPPSILHTKYNGIQWKIEISLEKQIEYYENKVIEKTKELESLRLVGFEGTIKFFNLEIEIVELRKKYLDANHELALQIENRLK